MRTGTIVAVCALLSLIRCPSQASAQTNQIVPAPPGKLIDVGGYRVHLYCIGAGSPAVVIAGAGYSFDWGLVQPEVATFTQVCAYDHSGIGWSDTGPKDSCSLRVSEIHAALKNAGIRGPYVLVGHSLGGLVARVYVGQHPGEVAGIVFVDHAFFVDQMLSSIRPSTLPGVAKGPPPSITPPAPGTGRAVGLEDDPNFSMLSSRDREFHLWATAQARDQAALQSNIEVSMECAEQADAIAKEHAQPLGDKPLVDISTDIPGPEYRKLQSDLLSLSRNSKQMVAEKSGHFVIIDRPDVVIDAIRQVVQSIRDNN